VKLFIATGSATYAQKANRVLNAVNIKNRITRHASDGSMGCGYGVEISEGNSDDIVRILTEAGVRIAHVKRWDT